MYINTDILIIGSGVAGLYSALNLRDDLRVTIITRKKVTNCNSYLAQGGISTALNDEDKESYIEDTLRAGEYKNNLEAVRILVDESMENIRNLNKLGVSFDKNYRDFDYTKEAAHSINRIVHCGDETGKSVVNVLYALVKQKKNVEIIENATLIDFICENNTCRGGIVKLEKDYLNINAEKVILASGGIGGIFKNSTNDRSITGIGIAMALKHNIKLKDMEYIQFHPTALYEEKKSDGKRFLISESLRGEGAKLLNIYGKPFVNELLPRNVLSNKILREQEITCGNHVLLDIRHMDMDFVKRRFSGIYRGCLERGVDITRGLIPVTPAQHYFMGGIEVDLFSRSSMRNLYACGEVSCTGVHGSNRLASNSLLEALVFSKRAAKDINENFIKDRKNDNNMRKLSISFKEDINETLVIKEFERIRGDIKNELVSCG